MSPIPSTTSLPTQFVIFSPPNDTKKTKEQNKQKTNRAKTKIKFTIKHAIRFVLATTLEHGK